MKICRQSSFIVILISVTINAESQYLKRSLSTAAETLMELSTPTAHYLPMFGAGDDSSSVIKGILRFGNLIVNPSGKSETVKYAAEEVVLYILEGNGILKCGKEEVPVTSNDFAYLPSGTRFSILNPRERNLSVIIMVFKVIPGNPVKPSDRMMIASADEVPFQVLGSHGPTTTFQLLMGTTESTRDRLAAACQVNSLFVMDFASNGTNIPHRHDDEEEIYLILRGKGDIVAGETSDGKELRHPSSEGDAYFFSPKTLIGFYSGNSGEEEHARILAVRFIYPSR